MVGMDKSDQLRAILTVCRSLGAEVDYCQERGYFTAMVWEDELLSPDASRALSIQEQIQKETAQYPGLVCYCFGPFSTLVYMV